MRYTIFAGLQIYAHIVWNLLILYIASADANMHSLKLVFMSAKFNLFCFLILFCFSCDAPQTPATDTATNEVRPCWESRFVGSPIDYGTALNHMERSMVVAKHMTDATGASYRQLVQNIVDRNQISFAQMAISPILYEDLRACLQFANPAVGSIPHKLLGIMDTIPKLGDLSPSTVMKPFLDSFEEDEWENVLVKHYAVALPYQLSKLLTVDKGLSVKLPPLSDEEQDISKLLPRNILQVEVDAKNQILIRGDLISLEELKPIAKAFIANPDQDPQYAQSPKHAVISLRNERGTTYKVYLEVYDALKTAYDELREEASQQQFGKSYEVLSDAEKKEIREQIPLVISEAEPMEFE